MRGLCPSWSSCPPCRRKWNCKGVALTPGQILELAGTTAAFYNLAFSSSGTLCYTPHHRVEIVRADGSKKFRFEICFECDKYQYSGEGPRNLPSAWRVGRAGGFFTTVGLPPRTFNEYSALLAAKMLGPRRTELIDRIEHC